MSEISFLGRVAVVTGSGGGLGKTYAIELARRGCAVVVNDLGGDRHGKGGSTSLADETVAEIKGFQGEAVANYDSVSTFEGGEAIIKTALEKYGKIDILIHNAGILRDRSFANMSAEEWHGVINVHLDGAFNVAKPAWLAMREKNYGRIVFTSSVSGLFGNFGQANYGAAKTGQVGLMHVLAIEGQKYGIKVNTISPAALTRMTEDLQRPEDRPDVDESPTHITPAVVFLASEQCQATSHIIHAGNGFFGRIQVAYNPGVFLGKTPVSVETFAENWDPITDTTEMAIQSPEERYMQYVLKKAAR
ncbi:MAG: SDR family NAD(P)-dependent oxidoreductase [SAR324 cluster bacterium]|nr:SDR family NAD(P)-dependent oxidoreductase [SAR324 cluster bacterium]